MAGYTSRWDCRICKASQESVDAPKMLVCDECIRPVADRLCREALGKPLGTPGIDEQHWLVRADAAMMPMMRRWKNPEPTVKFLHPEPAG